MHGRTGKNIGFYAFMGALACFAVSISSGAYLDSKSGQPERNAADLKAQKEKAPPPCEHRRQA
jgi:hypothetical protein